MASEDGPGPTFRRHGVCKGMEGSGVTRIDTVLANGIGAATVAQVEYVWDNSCLFDHVAIKAALSVESMQQNVTRAGRQITTDLGRHL